MPERNKLFYNTVWVAFYYHKFLHLQHTPKHRKKNAFLNNYAYSYGQDYPISVYFPDCRRRRLLGIIGRSRSYEGCRKAHPLGAILQVMTFRLPRPQTSLLALLALILILPLPAMAKESQAQGFKGPVYQQGSLNNTDFRQISTLGEFDLIVSRDRWRGIRADDLLTQFSKFNGIHGSPALREIWRNVLLGDFTGLNFKNNAQQADLMAERIRLLNRLGYFDEAVRLYVEASRKKNIPEVVARQGVEALALSGSADGACLETLMAAQYLQNDFWVESGALCAAYFGEKNRAEDFYAKVSKKAGGGYRSVYKTLLSGGTRTIQSDIPPLWRTLLLASGSSLSSLQKADAMTLAAVANNPKVSLGLRLAAANRAADLGTIGPDQLRKLYEAKNDTPESVAGISDGSIADLYGAARFTFEGNPRARIVRTAMRKLEPITNIKGHTFAWIVDKLTLQKEKMDWFAPYGFALMAATNRRASADMYYEVGHLDKSPMAIAHAMLEQKPWTPESQKIWATAMKRTGKSANISHAYEVVRAFDVESKLALSGKNIAIKTDAVSKSTLLQESVRKGGRGLTLVAALNRLGTATKLSRVSTSETFEIITVLGKEGLFGERKKIALEILLQTVL
jgi:hypothetical protein